MSDDPKIKESIDFVAKHYDAHAFSKKKAWMELVGKRNLFFKPRIAAASIAACILLAASALIYNRITLSNRPTSPADVKTVEQPAQKTKDFSSRLEFTDASLKDVVKKFESVYEVRIVNVPDTDIRLTLSYEGTAEDLISTINELEGTQMRVER